MIKSLLPIIFSLEFFKKLFALVIFFGILFALKSFIPLFLITFIFAYLFLEVAKFAHTKIHNASLKKNHGFLVFLRKHLSINIIVSIVYIIFLIVLIFLFSTLIPRIGLEIEKLVQNAPQTIENLNALVKEMETSLGFKLGIQNQVNEFLSNFDFKELGNNVLGYIKDAGGFLIKFIIGLVLSYIFIIDRKSIYKFLDKMKTGNFAFFYNEYKYLGSKIATGFGRVFKAQSLIAIINSILTSIGLVILSFLMGHGHEFPYIFTLSIVVFIFGFIPVFGTFLSGLPIIIIAYGFGGIPMVFGIIIMIAVIHAIEAYILNPKIFSSYTHFPVFITFVILLISEHAFGLIGLLIGIPIFSIFLSMFEDLDTHITKIKKEIKEIPNCKS
ncbi:hypothetical protein CSB09_03300 [Candidatus Gracilibacteria bacterium]|nr:MAG: hypothetical protein CSB09_03300 [Candidatus Gracilibacteria bacterium]